MSARTATKPSRLRVPKMPWIGPSWAMLPCTPRNVNGMSSRTPDSTSTPSEIAEQHAQHIAERPRGLQGVAHVPDHDGEERERGGRDPAPERRRRGRAPEDAHERPAEEEDQRRRHEPHERDLLPPGDEHADAQRAEPDDDRDVGDASRDPLDRERREHRAEDDERVGAGEGCRGQQRAQPARRATEPRRGCHGTCLVSSPRSIAALCSAGPTPMWGDCLILYPNMTSSSQPHPSSGEDSARPCTSRMAPSSVGSSVSGEYGRSSRRSHRGRSTAKNHERHVDAEVGEPHEHDPDDAELQVDVDPHVVRLHDRRRRGR